MKISIKFILLFTIISYFLPFLILNKLNINTMDIQSEDTLPTMFLPVVLIKEQTIYLDSYYSMMIQRFPQPDDKKQILGLTPFYLKKVNGHYLSAFPLISGILALPVYLLPVLFNVPITWESLTFLSRLSSALIMAFSGYFLYLIAKKFLTEKKSIFITLVYLFGTINFASISQALWQHGTLELFTLISLYFLISREKLFLAGLFMGTAVLSRPTAALPLAILLIFIFKNYKFKGTARYLLGVIPSVLFFFLYNNIFYQSVSNQGYASQLLDSWRTPFYLGFSGLLFSPSKGILIYSPVLIFSFFAIYLIFKKRNIYISKLSIFKYFPLVIFSHLLILGAWKHWYGGWAFGYRMASDIIPYIILMLIPYLSSEFFYKTKKLVLILFAISVMIQIVGLVFFDGVWHAAYDRGFNNQSWLWSLSNSEMVFYFRRLLVKVGLLSSPI